MKIGELIDRLRQFDPDSEVHVQLDSRRFASPTWVGMMDTAGLFDEEKDFQLVISSWEPEEYLKLGSDPAAKEQKKLRAQEAARKLAALGGTMPDMRPIPRRRPPRK